MPMPTFSSAAAMQVGLGVLSLRVVDSLKAPRLQVISIASLPDLGSLMVQLLKCLRPEVWKPMIESPGRVVSNMLITQVGCLPDVCWCTGCLRLGLKFCALSLPSCQGGRVCECTSSVVSLGIQA
eukprot:1638236-Amphidinium_carterae.1